MPDPNDVFQVFRLDYTTGDKLKLKISIQFQQIIIHTIGVVTSALSTKTGGFCSKQQT